MNQCAYCGQMWHSLGHSGPCPFLLREHEARTELLFAQVARARALALRAEQRVVGLVQPLSPLSPPAHHAQPPQDIPSDHSA